MKEITVEDVILQCLRFMAGNDLDHARERNNVGFNSSDTDFGCELAEKDHLTYKQQVAAVRMMQKYTKSQLIPAGLFLPEISQIVDTDPGPAQKFDGEIRYSNQWIVVRFNSKHLEWSNQFKQVEGWQFHPEKNYAWVMPLNVQSSSIIAEMVKVLHMNEVFVDPNLQKVVQEIAEEKAPAEAQEDFAVSVVKERGVSSAAMQKLAGMVVMQRCSYCHETPGEGSLVHNAADNTYYHVDCKKKVEKAAKRNRFHTPITGVQQVAEDAEKSRGKAHYMMVVCPKCGEEHRILDGASRVCFNCFGLEDEYVEKELTDENA